MFQFEDKIKFTKAIYHNFNPIPLPKPFKDGTGGMGRFAPEQGCIELYDDQGMCSHYNCTRGFVQNILPVLMEGECKSYQEWRAQLYWRVRNSGHQSSQAVEVGQLDFIMLDILAQRAGQPLHRFLGAKKDYANAYKGGGSLLLEDSELVEDMLRYKEEGYPIVKFKVGSNDGTDMERDVRRLGMVRAAVGDETGVAVDANQRWTVEEAYRFAEMIEPYHVAWLEEPIHAHDMNGIKRLKEMGISVPVAFGESMRISYAYETYIEKGVDHLQPSLGRMTRIDDLWEIRRMAREHNVRFSSGGRVYINAIMGCVYDEDELIEYHEPISKPVGEYTLFQPEEKNGRFYVQTDIPGNPQRMDLKKLERDCLLESTTRYYAHK